MLGAAPQASGSGRDGLRSGVDVGDWLRMVAALAVLGPLAYWTARVVGSRSVPRPSRHLRLVDALALGGDRYVFLVAVGRQRLLVLGVSGSQLVRLDSIEAPELVEELVGQSSGPSVPFLYPVSWRQVAHRFKRRG